MGKQRHPKWPTRLEMGWLYKSRIGVQLWHRERPLIPPAWFKRKQTVLRSSNKQVSDAYQLFWTAIEYNKPDKVRVGSLNS